MIFKHGNMFIVYYYIYISDILLFFLMYREFFCNIMNFFIYSSCRCRTHENMKILMEISSRFFFFLRKKILKFSSIFL